jgi:hypothetical protein
MAIELIINNNSYEYPENNENPGWGEDATAWAEAVTQTLETLQGSNDIPLTSANIIDNTSDNVLGLAFNIAQVLQFRAEYTVKRTDGVTIIMETGILYGYNDDMGAMTLSQESHGDGQITFDITAAGQVTYDTTDNPFAGQTSGVITFKASTMNK